MCFPFSVCYSQASLEKKNVFVFFFALFARISYALKRLLFLICGLNYAHFFLSWSSSYFGRCAIRGNCQAVVFCFLMMPPAVFFFKLFSLTFFSFESS